MKIYLTILNLLTLNAGMLFAQNVRFPASGVITFEKRVNTHAIGRKMNAHLPGHKQGFAEPNEQFLTLRSTLTFSEGKTFFSPVQERVGTQAEVSFAQPNMVYTDLAGGTFVTQKNFIDDLLLITDSIPKIDWKLTSETRTIAGYECRRANAIIMDSVYVVAFYATQIPVSGGPESFTGLPGMILGLALPGEHLTWFATSVTDRAVPPTEIRPPAKGKPMNNKQFKELVEKYMSRFGARRYLFSRPWLL